jgi:hypothetical protein
VPKNNKELKKKYLYLNKKFFDDKLPKDMEVEFKNLYNVPKDSCIGCTDLYGLRPINIAIDTAHKNSPGCVHMTLVHEMVHVENPTFQHGLDFQMRMLQLARKGIFFGYW